MPIAEQHVQSKPSGTFFSTGRDAAVVEDPTIWTLAAGCIAFADAAPRASGALRERLLQQKGYGEAIVDEVIERLIRVQLIDDCP